MDQSIRNKLRSVVTQCRKLLEDAVAQVLQGQFGIYSTGKKDEVNVDDDAKMKHLSDEDRAYRKDILDHLEHVKALGYKPTDSLAQLVREIAFTHLNRFCAYKMMEARSLIRESVSKGLKSQGFLFYLADHEDDEKRANSGQQDVAYRHFLNWLGGTLSEEIGVLFNPHDSANRLYPPQRVLDDVLNLLNEEALTDIWTQDETIGWVYQYFTPKELREQVRKESAAPRNSYELAFRNQFFTPRYVVEFLTDNTLGRIWYEMRKGDTKLKDQCRYMVRRPNEVFLADPIVVAQHLGIPVTRVEDIPPNVQAAFRGDFGNAITEDFGRYRSWIGSVVPLDQYEAATGYPYRENDKHPAVDEVWSAIFEPNGKMPLPPLKILVAISQLVMTSSGGPYADRAAQQLWTALTAAAKAHEVQSELSHDEVVKQPVCIPHRPKKDPRELKILDPACGSGHFLLYCFDLLITVYEEAYGDPELGPALQRDYPTLDALKRDVPRLILAHNLHGIDIDLRASQIAALALWLRCQRAYQEMGLKKDRPKITRSNFVCAEPMPGEPAMLKEFVGQLEPMLLGQLVEVVFDKMKLAGEAGSLLKIEEEIRTAVASAKQQWEADPIEVQRTLFDSSEPKPKQKRFNLSGVTDDEFFNEAESKVVEALRNYAENATNGRRLQRRLFTEDAVRGFAFVDLCHKRFDVVLMNPPFGESSTQAKAIIEKQYPRTKNDLYAAFVERGLFLLNAGGRVGAITSRTGFFLSRYQKWREEILLQEAHPTVVADLGYGVLDTAMVETACYCLEIGKPTSDALFFRLLFHDDKAESLLKIVIDLRSKQDNRCVHVLNPQLFRKIPRSPFAYWSPRRILTLFDGKSGLEGHEYNVRKGLDTNDDFQFFRLFWETPVATRRYVPLAKGGPFAKFHNDISLVLDWTDSGSQLRAFLRRRGDHPSRNIRSEDKYFKAGMTWSQRSQKGLSVRILPAGCIFSTKGPGIIPQNSGQLFGVLGLLNSSAYAALINLQMAFGSYDTGILKITPVPIPELSTDAGTRIADITRKAVDLKRYFDCCTETAHGFVLPEYCLVEGVTVADRERAWVNRQQDIERESVSCQSQIDELAYRLYGIDPKDAQQFEEILQKSPLMEDGAEPSSKTEDDQEVEDLCEDASKRVHSIVSYGFGCSFGRWDIRFANGQQQMPDLPDPFAPLPECSPGMLQESDKIPAKDDPRQYPVRINWDGVIPDDPDHPDDIVRRVGEVVGVIWNDRAEDIEKEACEILGVRELRDYFRKPGKGGFWDAHISRYSKSRRKAPIYWLLQSSKKNYAVWLYYHRLDKDQLFKALVNYVEPKIRMEANRLDSLRSQKAAAGDTGKAAKKIDVEIEKQEDFISELRDFEDKLRRAANLHLEPDLNDGVVLNIAPLHELVPWKEAKSYWNELIAGEYEWSSIGKQLREKGLVK